MPAIFPTITDSMDHQQVLAYRRACRGMSSVPDRQAPMNPASPSGAAEVGAGTILGVVLIAGIPIATLVWVGFTLSHWVLGWAGLFLTLAALAGAGAVREHRQAGSDALDDIGDREPVWVALREIALSLIGVMAGVSLLALLFLLLR